MKIILFSFLILLTSSISAQISVLVNLVANNDSSKFIFGGYGEVLYQYMDYGPNSMEEQGAPTDQRGVLDLPRMVLSLDYRFKNGFALSTEIEFEHGGTGATYEYEYEETGEWEIEIEKGGEVVLEQFYLSKTFSRAFSIKMGHVVVPIGLTNLSHLPNQFFGTVRPEGENTIIPLTWHETGISFVGKIRRWSYEAQIVNGLDANGMTSAYWIRKAKQTQYETVKMNVPAYVLRINNQSIKNLTLGTSFYHGNSAANSSKPEKMEHIKGAVTIGTFDALYRSKNLIFRGNFIYGNLTDSEEIYRLNVNMLSRYSPYSPSPVGKNAMTYSAEIGYNIFSLFKTKGKLYPFVRHEYLNSMHEVEGNTYQKPRFNKTITTIGLNYFPIPNLVIKGDYAMRRIDGGNYNNENTFGLAVGYYGIFVKR